MITRSGLVERWVEVLLQIPITDSTLGLSALILRDGRPFNGNVASWSTAWTWRPAPIENSVSVAVGDSDTMHRGGVLVAAPTALTPMSGRVRTPTQSERVNRVNLNMDISFPSKWVGRRMDIRTTAPYLESCLSHLLAAGALATWAPKETHLQLRDSVGFSPTSLPRGSTTLHHGDGG